MACKMVSTACASLLERPQVGTSVPLPREIPLVGASGFFFPSFFCFLRGVSLARGFPAQNSQRGGPYPKKQKKNIHYKGNTKQKGKTRKKNKEGGYIGSTGGPPGTHDFSVRGYQVVFIGLCCLKNQKPLVKNSNPNHTEQCSVLNTL